MKLRNTILDQKLNLIGFLIEGNEREFGGITDSTVVRPVSGKEMIRIGFVNEQIDTRSGKIRCRGSFRLSELKPKVMVNNEFHDIDNRVTLTKRILYNGDLKGFEVQCSDGTCIRMTYESALKLGSIFIGTNFVVRLGKERPYIAGTRGSINLLPEVEIGKGKNTSKRKRAGISTKQIEADETALAGADLLSLYDIVDSVDGIVVKLPSERYKSRTGNNATYDESFKSLGIGEVGQPRLDFGEKKLNANTNFKNLGLVTVAVNGIPTPVYSFTYSTKTIFAGLENHMEHFVIGVKADVASEIGKIYGNNLIVRNINDENITKPIATITGKELVYFEVDTSNLKLMSDKRAETLAKTPIKDIGNAVYHLAILKARSKLLKDISNEAMELGSISKSDTATIAPLFSGFTTEYLKAFMDAGIDIYTGAYIKQVKAESGDKDKADSAKEKVLEQTIELAFKGLDNKKLTLKNVKAVMNGESKPDSKIVELAGLVGIAETLYAERNLKSRLESATKMKNEVDKNIRKIVKNLWLWKVAMVSLGDNNMLNNSVWEPVKTRAKNSSVYENMECGGLVLKLTGIELGKAR